MSSVGTEDPNDTNQIIHIATVSAPTNIACIKYWGKADAKWNTPTNDSVSVTLDQSDLRAVTTAAASKTFSKDRLWLNGIEDVDAHENKRFRACIDGVKALADQKWSNYKIHVSSYNTFPTAAGLASSAAGYAALVAALVELLQAKESYPGEFSTIARQGSGSACRSLMGGFVAWRAGSSQDNWKNSLAEQICSEKHWPELRALILVVSDAKKDTSSTAGMSTSVATSTLLQHRISAVVPRRMKDIENAFQNKDFTKFGELTMKDSNQFHAVCMDTYPPIFYLNDVSRIIVRIVHAYNKWSNEIRAAYTFDAGPNAVLYTLDRYVIEVGALMLHYFPSNNDLIDQYINNTGYAQEIQDFKISEELLLATDKCGRTPASGDVKMFYYTKSGPGPQVLSIEESNLDPKTGLNIYKP